MIHCLWEEEYWGIFYSAEKGTEEHQEWNYANWWRHR